MIDYIYVIVISGATNNCYFTAGDNVMIKFRFDPVIGDPSTQIVYLIDAYMEYV